MQSLLGVQLSETFSLNNVSSIMLLSSKIGTPCLRSESTVTVHKLILGKLLRWFSTDSNMHVLHAAELLSVTASWGNCTSTMASTLVLVVVDPLHQIIKSDPHSKVDLA